MKSVLILGNARSGTSMTAGVLSILGVDIRHSNIINEQNPKGSFESKDWNIITTKIHKEILNSKIFEDIIDDYQYEILQLIEMYQSELWGWKSALTHRALDVYIPYLENPHLVIVTRNIVKNINSWIRHMKTNYGTNVSWEVASNNILNSTNILFEQVNKTNCPKIWVTYEDLKQKPLIESQRMADFINVELDDMKKDEILGFIMPEYSTLN